MVKVVLLNSCRGAVGGASAAFNIAGILVSAGIQFALGMSYDILAQHSRSLRHSTLSKPLSSVDGYPIAVSHSRRQLRKDYESVRPIRSAARPMGCICSCLVRARSGASSPDRPDKAQRTADNNATCRFH